MTFDWESLALKVAPYVLAAVASGGALAVYNHGQREIGKRDILLEQSRAELKASLKVRDSLAKVYRVDTLRLWRLKNRTDSLTIEVERWKYDTVQVVQYVLQADSTIKACTVALGTCEARVGAEKARGDALQRQNAILHAQIPSRVVPWRDRLLGLSVGVLAGRLAR